MPNSSAFVLANLIVVGLAADARAQVAYVGSGPSYAQPVSGVAAAVPNSGTYVHAYRDEPVMSVNTSYLGYSNFVNLSQPAPRFISGRQSLEKSVYVPVPEQRAGRWFGWRRRARQ